MTTTFSVPARFCGPASSGNGGWTAGAVAALLDAETVRVSLHRPPPLEVPLAVTGDSRSVEVGDDGGVVARGEAVATDPTAVEAVPVGIAHAAESAYPGLVSHPFPTCFVCGPERAEGDGLRIFPGQVASAPTRTAATWTPHPSLADGSAVGSADGSAEGTADGATVPLPIAWAALDCAGGWAADLTERTVVLASMTARVDTLPRVGTPYVVVGEHRGTEGRKTFTATSLYDADGGLLAAAEQLWIAVDPAFFR